MVLPKTPLYSRSILLAPAVNLYTFLLFSLIVFLIYCGNFFINYAVKVLSISKY